MTRETAVTDTIEYETHPCVHCGVDVALTKDKHDSIDTTGNVVVLGTGKVRETDQGNSTQTKFVNPSERPQTESFVACNACIDEVHDPSQEVETFTGILKNSTTSEKESLIDSRILLFLLAMFGILILIFIIA
jgi:hypothetical protein